MAEFKGTIETKKQRQAKAAAALAGTTTSVFDIVKREDYENEAAYIKALYDTEQIMSSATYREWHRAQVKAEREKAEADALEAQKAAYKEFKENVKLTPAEIDSINAEATRLAHDALANGKIKPQELGKAIADHAEKLTDKAKSSRAADKVFNKVLRGELSGISVDEGE